MLVLAKVALSFCTPECPLIQITIMTNPIMKHLIVQDSHSVISHPALNKEMFEEEKKSETLASHPLHVVSKGALRLEPNPTFVPSRRQIQTLGRIRLHLGLAGNVFDFA